MIANGLLAVVNEDVAEPKSAGFDSLSLDELNNQLSEAIDNEDYELASKIRDEINKRNEE